MAALEVAIVGSSSSIKGCRPPSRYGVVFLALNAWSEYWPASVLSLVLALYLLPGLAGDWYNFCGACTIEQDVALCMHGLQHVV